MSSLIASWSNSPLLIKILTSLSILVATVFVIKKFFLRATLCTEKKDLSGKVIVITGGNSGIGYAKALTGMGGTVIIACRDTKKADAAIARIKSENSNAKIETLPLDISSFDSIKQFVSTFTQKYDKVDVLINNAGILAVPKAKTKDGYEIQFGTNYLGHFLLTRLLIPYLKKAQKARVISISSIFHNVARPGRFNGGNFVIDLEDVTGDKRYNKWARYAQSKACSILFTIELAKRLKGTGIEAFSLHPGLVATDLYNNVATTVESLATRGFNYLFAKNVVEGAQTTIYAAISSQLEGKSGAYLAECGVGSPSSYASDPALASKLWSLSCKLTSLPEDI